MTAYIKITNRTDRDWPKDAVMHCNINKTKQPFSLLAKECIYREVKIRVEEQVSHYKEIVFWFTDSSGERTIGQAIIFRLSIYCNSKKFSESNLDLVTETVDATNRNKFSDGIRSVSRRS